MTHSVTENFILRLNKFYIKLKKHVLVYLNIQINITRNGIIKIKLDATNFLEN